MTPKTYLSKFAKAVTMRSGICQATVEQVLPAVFDEIRFQLIEGRYHCVPIESFGTFGIVDIPERQYRYTYCGKDEVRTLPPTKRLKFYPTRSMRREIENGQFDPSRQSFKRNLSDPPIRKRNKMQYQPKRGVYKGATTFLDKKPQNDTNI